MGALKVHVIYLCLCREFCQRRDLEFSIRHRRACLRTETESYLDSKIVFEIKCEI